MTAKLLVECRASTASGSLAQKEGTNLSLPAICPICVYPHSLRLVPSRHHSSTPITTAPTNRCLSRAYRLNAPSTSKKEALHPSSFLFFPISSTSTQMCAYPERLPGRRTTEWARRFLYFFLNRVSAFFAES